MILITPRFKQLVFFSISLLFMGQIETSAEGSTNSAPKPKAVATVNGLPIYEATLTAEMERIAAKGWTTGMAGNTKESKDQRKKKALETLISNELVRQASRTQAIEDIETKITQRIQGMKKKYPSEDDFATFLKRKNKTIEDLRAEARDDILFLEYLHKIKKQDIQISDSAVENFYNSTKKSYIVPEQIKTRHILVSIEGTSAEQNEKALKKITELREQVLKLKDFALVAKESSSCASATNGGELEYIARGYMPADFDTVAFSLKIGEISAPVKTRHGYHIIEVLGKKPEYVRPLKEVKEFITTYLKSQASEERVKTHIVELKNKATIGIIPD